MDRPKVEEKAEEKGAVSVCSKWPILQPDPLSLLLSLSMRCSHFRPPPKRQALTSTCWLLCRVLVVCAVGVVVCLVVFRLA